MTRVAVGLVALLSVTRAAGAQPVSFDFEAGLQGWESTGDAFRGQPVKASEVRTDDVSPVTLGGSYWRGLSYPLGQQRLFLVRSSVPLTGTLTSGERSLAADDRFFSVLIGGSTVGTQVELQVRTAAGSFDTIFVARAAGAALSRATYEIPPRLVGMRARVVLVDHSTTGHVSADDIRFSAEPPEPHRSPVWGLGDFHTHPMSHLAFGGLRGVSSLWGLPGGAVSDYAANSELIARDIPVCLPGHGGGHSAEVFINSAEGRFLPRGVLKDLWALLTGRLTRHRREGGASFRNFPAFRAGAHQQMHVTQVYRAWQGGLRLMVAIAVHNVGVEFLTAKLKAGEVHPSSELEVLRAQICGMRQLAALNASWMEIAYGPEQARDIIHRGKLAVVLGIEMDQLGQLTGASLEQEIDHLWSLGVRQVTPVHAVDNRLGGAAVFQPVYNSLNDLLHRAGGLNLSPKQLPTPASFFNVAEAGCGTAGAPPSGECVEFALSPEQQRAAIFRTPTSFFRRAPFITASHVEAYEGVRGMVNTAGLTADGRTYLRLLMSRGLVVGLEHMSKRSVEDVYRTVGDWLVERGHPECARFGVESVPAACYDAAYPLSVSHAHLRRVSLPRKKTTVAAFRASEYEVGDRQAEVVGQTAGVIGQFVSEDPVVLPAGVEPPPFANDCAGSSKSFATSLWYALQRLQWRGVGLASDFTFIPGATPRFGRDACSADAAATDRSKERALLPAQYQKAAQLNRVLYTTPNGASPVASLTPYVMGRRTYDFNDDGFAHYGLLPDLLQDLHNIGVPARAFAALFASAEDYLQMWAKAERLSGRQGAAFSAIPVDCRQACAGRCPDDGIEIRRSNR